jgi:hypothetical protein
MFIICSLCNYAVGNSDGSKRGEMSMSRHQTAGQNHYTVVASKAFENVAEFKCLGTKLTSQNYIHEDIKSGLNSGNACCRTIQGMLAAVQFRECLLPYNSESFVLPFTI